MESDNIVLAYLVLMTGVFISIFYYCLVVKNENVKTFWDAIAISFWGSYLLPFFIILSLVTITLVWLFFVLDKIGKLLNKEIDQRNNDGKD